MISERGLLQYLKITNMYSNLFNWWCFPKKQKEKKKPPRFHSCSQWNAVFESHSYLCLYEIQTEAGTCSVILYNCIRTRPHVWFSVLPSHTTLWTLTFVCYTLNGWFMLPLLVSGDTVVCTLKWTVEEISYKRITDNIDNRV